MKDYSAMSDFDIQQAVLHETWGKHPVRLLGKMMLDIMLSDYDPCNNPADAWPIIVANKISILIDETVDYWSSALVHDFCDADAFSHGTSDNNPLRAAMIVFLMMKDAEKCDG